MQKIGEKHRKTLSQRLESNKENNMGASGSVAKQIAADLRSVESGRQMSAVNDFWGGEQREKDSDKCSSVVLIVQCCPAISPHRAKAR